MSGRGSPRRKLSCSVIAGCPDRYARPDRSPLYAAADPPAFGRCPTGRSAPRGPYPWGPSVGPSGRFSDRPRVLFSIFGEPLCKGDQGSNGEPLRPLWSVWPIPVEPKSPGDVEVRPLGSVLDSRLEECRRG